MVVESSTIIYDRVVVYIQTVLGCLGFLVASNSIIQNDVPDINPITFLCDMRFNQIIFCNNHVLIVSVEQIEQVQEVETCDYRIKSNNS